MIKFNCFIKAWFRYACIASAYCVCKADDNLQTRQFIESCYGSSYDQKAEMTDVILVDARYSDSDQIKELGNTAIHKYLSNTNSGNWNNLLDDIFTTTSIKNNANIKLFRERIFGDYYRLDTMPDLRVFPEFEWNGGKFTNEHPFMMVKIGVPPNNTNKLWTLYEEQPDASRMGIQTGEKKLTSNTDFYIHLHQLPSLFLLNVIMQTDDTEAAQEAAKTNNLANISPNDFGLFKIDERRLTKAIGVTGVFKNWTVRPFSSSNQDLKELLAVNSDGTDNDRLRILFSGSNPLKKYLAYIRDRNGAIVTLSAWDFDKNDKLIHFLRIEQGPDEKLAAWAQNIVYVNKSTNIDWSVFNVDASKFSSIYDQRGKYPIQTVNGKVVFDASKDKYSPSPGTVVKPNWFDTTTGIRAIILIVFLLPLPFFIYGALKKRNSE